MKAIAAIARGHHWRQALSQATAQMPPLLSSGQAIDLTFLFASSDYADEFPELLAAAAEAIPASTLIGCSGQGIIGHDQEVEDQPALALLSFSLPGAALTALHLTQADLERCSHNPDWHHFTGVSPDRVNAWFLFADPFTLDAEGLLAGLSQAYPDTPLVGGLASGDFHHQQTHLFLGGTVYDSGAVALALGGPYGVRTIVSQGCTPIGEPWIITGAHGHIIQTIAQRPAYQVLLETVQALPLQVRQRVHGNIFIGLAMNEYQEEFRRGDFLIRNILGVDPASGALAVGATPRPGQTIQFHLRDRAAADEDLQALLETARADLPQQPIAALLCSCNGRGRGLFGSPDHDAKAVTEGLGPIPLAGFFCNGEIGPVGSRNFLHGFTASIGLIVPREPMAKKGSP